MNRKIREGNELIAKFMGAKASIIFVSTEIVTFPRLSIFPHRQFKISALKYHNNWQWLMPVVEKICRMKIGDGKTTVDYAHPYTFGMMDDDGNLMVRLEGFPLYRDPSLIVATWEAVVDFIKFYNERSH